MYYDSDGFHFQADRPDKNNNDIIHRIVIEVIALSKRQQIKLLFVPQNSF